MGTFKAVVLREEADEVSSRLENVELDQLSEGDLIVKVEYSTVNYKDMLGFQKDSGVIRNYPMIPGIDFAGEVISSQTKDFEQGDRILVNSTDRGVNKTGGYAEYARVASKDVIRLPEALSSREAMTLGTAGFTAALSVDALINHGMSVENNPAILVTGATGGVGSVALSILSKLGFQNIQALVRKDYQAEIAEALGADKIVSVQELRNASRTLASRKYHYVLDTVGGDTAAHALAQIYENGSMTLCGNAGGNQLEMTVLPMILRGVNLLGINSVNYPKKKKEEIWNKLADKWYVNDRLVSQEVELENLTETITALREGTHVGRTVVKLTQS